MPYTPFGNRPEWSDVIPIKQLDDDAVSKIAYSIEYSDAMDYFRAIYVADEMSERALLLTQHILQFNPAHFTVWTFRRRVVEALQKDPMTELEYANQMAIDHPKNYQIWNHRQIFLTKLEAIPDDEIELLDTILEEDAKNYHVWTHRQWVTNQFNLWESELQATERYILEDICNNSAWSYRHFLLSHIPERRTKESFHKELVFTLTQIQVAPNNESPWVYLQGIHSLMQVPLSSMLDFYVHFFKSELPSEDDIFSVAGNTFLLEVIQQSICSIADARKEMELKATAKEILQKLAQQDPVRQKYWHWRQAQIDSISTVAAQ